jgi:type II secretory pathway component PulC
VSHARSLELGLRALRGAFVIAAMWVVGSSAAEFARAPAIELPRLAEAEPAAAAGAGRELSRYDVIARRNLFGGPSAALAPAAAQATAAVTTLPLRLLGTIVANPISRSLAVIADGGSNESVVVGTGDRIGDALVERIERDGVLLSRLGRLERIAFEDEKTPSAPAPRPAARAAAARANRARAPGTQMAARPAPPPPSAARPAPVRGTRPSGRDLDVPEAPPASPDSEETLRTLASQARFLPEFGEAGQVQGIAVSNVQAGSTLERLGLRDGDVVVSVAGHRVDNPQTPQMLRGLPLTQPFSVEIVRGGAPTTLQVPAGALTR